MLQTERDGPDVIDGKFRVALALHVGVELDFLQ